MDKSKQKINLPVILAFIFGFNNIFLISIILLVSLGLGNTGIIQSRLANEQYHQVSNLIKDNYIGDFPTDTELETARLKSLVSALDDPFSEYLSAKESNDFQNSLNRSYEGVGVSFSTENGEIIADRVLENSPAKEVGVENGDRLISVDGEDVSGKNFDNVANMIRGPEGTKVLLEFERSGEILTFDITRRSIQVDLITLEFEQDAAIIKINSFGDTVDESMDLIAIQILQNNNVERVILDLRSNTGGLLNQGINIASYFMEENELVLTEKSKDATQDDLSVKKENNLGDYPVLILVDEFTASASEIVAGALRDQKNAILIGEQTFGKGVVQKLFNLSNGDVVKLTVAEWFTPNGDKINEIGLTPDLEVSGGEALETALNYED